MNRATQGLYPPGSTFKVVTAAAGLDSGVITPETTIDAPARWKSKGRRCENDFGEDFFGAITLDTALTNSVNTWFGQLGQQLGNDTLFEYMERFGFNATPAIDLPEDEVERERGLGSRKRRTADRQATRSTSPASRSARSGCWRRRCRWRRSRPRSPTAAS